jgi:hypothetical protein
MTTMCLLLRLHNNSLHPILILQEYGDQFEPNLQPSGHSLATLAVEVTRRV